MGGCDQCFHAQVLLKNGFQLGHLAWHWLQHGHHCDTGMIKHRHAEKRGFLDRMARYIKNRFGAFISSFHHCSCDKIGLHLWTCQFLMFEWPSATWRWPASSWPRPCHWKRFQWLSDKKPQRLSADLCRLWSELPPNRQRRAQGGKLKQQRQQQRQQPQAKTRQRNTPAKDQPTPQTINQGGKKDKPNPEGKPTKARQPQRERKASKTNTARALGGQASTQWGTPGQASHNPTIPRKETRHGLATWHGRWSVPNDMNKRAKFSAILPDASSGRLMGHPTTTESRRWQRLKQQPEFQRQKQRIYWQHAGQCDGNKSAASKKNHPSGRTHPVDKFTSFGVIPNMA